MLQSHKPHAIVVGASHPEARTLEQDLTAIKESILLDNPRFYIGVCSAGQGSAATTAQRRQRSATAMCRRRVNAALLLS